MLEITPLSVESFANSVAHYVGCCLSCLRGAPGKSGLHASGEGERVIAPEPW